MNTNWSKKNDGKSWERTEVGVKDQNEQKVINMLTELGSFYATGKLEKDEDSGDDNDEVKSTQSIIINSDIKKYLELRRDLKWSNIFDLPILVTEDKKENKKENKKNKKEVKKMSKKEEIIKDNNKKNHVDHCNSFIEKTGLRESSDGKLKISSKNKKKITDFISKSPGPITSTSTIEWKVIEIMFILNQVSNHANEIDKFVIYNLFFGIAKFITRIKEIEIRDMETTKIDGVNQQLISDLETVYENFKYKIALKKSVNQKEEKVKIIEDFAKNIVIDTSINYPRLFLDTCYDNILPGTAMKPYNSQIELMNNIMYDEGMLIFLASAMGEGKTTSIVPIAEYFSKKSDNIIFQDRKHRSEIVIYTCRKELIPVMEAATNSLHEAKIPRGNIYSKTTQDGKTKLGFENNWNCKQTFGRGNNKRFIETPPVVYITDVLCTVRLLKFNYESKRIIKALNDKEITFEDLSNEQKELFDEMEIEAKKDYCVIWDEPTVGLDQTNSEIINMIKDIMTVPPKWLVFSSATLPDDKKLPEISELYKRFYPQAKIKTIKPGDIRIGCEISTMDGQVYTPYNGITSREQLFKLIDIVRDGKLFQKMFTCIALEHMYSKLEKIIKIPIEFEFGNYMNKTENLNQQAIQNLAVKYLELLYEAPGVSEDIIRSFCSETYTKMRMNINDLINTSKNLKSQTLVVVSDPEEFFLDNFSSYYENICKDINSFTEFLENNDKHFKNWVDAKEKILISAEKSSKKGKKIDDNKETPAEIINQWEKENPCPSLNWKYKIDPNRSLKENGFSINQLKTEEWANIKIPDIYKAMLCAGIGVYKLSLPQEYTDLVIDCMREGKLVYIITDPDISYGMNYPIENIIITCVMIKHSYQTLLQLCARAGRYCKSDKANIWIDPAVLSKFTNYFNTDNFDDIELTNLRKAINNSVKEVNKRDYLGISAFLNNRSNPSINCLDESFDEQKIKQEQNSSLDLSNLKEHWITLAERVIDIVKSNKNGNPVPITHLNIWEDNEGRDSNGQRLFDSGQVNNFPKIRIHVERFENFVREILENITEEEKVEMLGDISLALLISICRICKIKKEEEKYLEEYKEQLENISNQFENNLFRKKLEYIQKVLTM